MIRGHNGVVYEPPDARMELYPAHDLIGLGAAPAQGSMLDHVALYAGEWPDQGLTESCVGHAICQAVSIRQGMMGVLESQRVVPAPTDIYYRARASRVGWGEVTDIGSNPVAGWEVLRTPADGLGIVSLADLPWDPFSVDKEPDPAIYRRAIDRDWLSYHWVLDDGQDRLVTLDALLGTGHPVTCALTVDQGLMDWTPSQGPWWYQGQRPLGGHYVCLVHADRESYWAVGSWGSDYGLAGLHQIARSEIASSRSSYFATPEVRT